MFTHYLAHFRENARRPFPVSLDALEREAAHVPEGLRSVLSGSLARFQLGETGEGRIVHQVKAFRYAWTDEAYRESVALFVAEEGRHARELGVVVRALGGKPIGAHWSHGSFAWLRHLATPWFKLLVLLVAEAVSVGAYEALSERLPPAFRAVLRRIADDERVHLSFHRTFFEAWARVHGGAAFLRCLVWVLGLGASCLLAWDHRRTVRALGGDARALLGRMLGEVGEVFHAGSGFVHRAKEGGVRF